MFGIPIRLNKADRKPDIITLIKLWDAEAATA